VGWERVGGIDQCGGGGALWYMLVPMLVLGGRYGVSYGVYGAVAVHL
jgi:hypothetical protein